VIVVGGLLSDLMIIIQRASQALLSSE